MGSGGRTNKLSANFYNRITMDLRYGSNTACCWFDHYFLVTPSPFRPSTSAFIRLFSLSFSSSGTLDKGLINRELLDPAPQGFQVDNHWH